MEWIRTHPYASALCAAGVLVSVGIFVVQRQVVQPTEPQAIAWGGGATPLLNPTSFGATGEAAEDERTLVQQVQGNPPYTYIAPDLSSPTSSENENPYDFTTFIATLMSGSAPKNKDATADDSITSAYAYIPRGLMSTTTPSSTRSDTQQALYDYGNDIGGTIESFERQHSNTAYILKGQVEDRANPEKAAAVVEIGHDLEELGNKLAKIEIVPPGMASAHKALAQSYIEIGKKLALIPSAERDEDFIKAIQSYNSSADTFTKNYVQLVSLFGAYGVTFTSNDSGSVFTFSQAASF